MTSIAMPARGLARRALLAVVAAVATALALVAAPPAAADEDEEVTAARAAGPDRYGTAATIATLDWDTSDDAFLTSGENFPDALAASYAAGEAGAESGPILLTAHTNLTDHTRTALDELDVQRVFIIGGTAAVHPSVEAELEQRGHEVVRVAGADRYDTAAEVAFAWGFDQHGEVGTLDGQRTALLGSGTAFPDALAAGAVSASAAFPLFLTPSASPHPSVDETLDELDIERIVVVGGNAAVSGDVVAHYEGAGYEVERWAGADRTETAAVIADNAVERLGFDVSLTALARGDAFPDALAGSVHAGLNNAPLVLSAGTNTLGGHTHAWLAAQCPEVDVIRAFGGTGAVSAATLDAAVSAAEECFAPDDPDTIAEPQHGDRDSGDMPRENEPATLTSIAGAQHDGFDRVVMEFAGPERPGWQVSQRDEATHPETGQDLGVRGETYLFAEFHFADYDGPDRVAVDGHVITEVVFAHDDTHGLVGVYIGLEREVPYATAFLEDAEPMQFVLDAVDE